MAYLDDTGLAYFWGKIKAWANSVFALLGHTHPSSDVTAMTGYSMPAASGSISSGDTLNQAVGKLEKAISDIDLSDVVHKTGDEIITGYKSFHSSTDRMLCCNHTLWEKGVVPNINLYNGILFADKNGSEWAANGVGVVQSCIFPSGDTSTYLRVVKNIANSTTSYTLGVQWDSVNDRSYGYCPTYFYNNDDNIIATTKWVRRYNHIACGYDNNITKPYCLIASSGARMTGNYIDWGITLLVDRPYAYGSGGSGICTVTVRTNNAAANETATCKLQWIARSGDIDNCIKVGLINTPGNAAIDIFFYTDTSYEGAFITVLSQSSNRYNNPNVYYPAGQGFQTFCDDGSSVDTRKYTTPNECAQALWGENYTNILNITSDYYTYYNRMSVSLTKGTNPSSRYWFYDLLYFDSAGTAVANRMAEHRMGIDTNGLCRNELLAYDFASGSTNAGILGIYCDKAGSYYACAPTPATADNSTKIATTAWVVNNIKEGVYTGFLCLKNSNCTKGTAPSGTLYWQLYANDKNAVQYSNTIGIFEVSLTNANLSGAYMRAMENTAGSTNQSTLGVWYDKPGGATYVTCSTIRPTNTSCTCGTSAKKWGAVWATNGTIQTSDERVKTAIDIIPEEVLDVWEGVQWKQFKLKDSVKEKGNRARLHTGIIAQQIQREFEAKNIDAAQYGFFCWDEWGDSDAILDSDGNVVVEAIKADEQYSVRYDEALCIEAAYMRRENARLKKRVADLEERLAALELRLGSE